MAENIFDFGEILKNRDKFEKWLKDNGLIKDVVRCGKCAEVMRPVAGKPQLVCAKKSQHVDGKLFRESSLKDSIFEGSRTSPEKIMEIIYCSL